MIRTRDILLALCLFSSSAWAGVAVDLSYGRTLTGSLQVGKKLALEQQGFALAADYVRNLSRGLIRNGNESFSLGLGFYTAQVNYRGSGVTSTGGNVFLTARTGWLLFLANKTWLIQLTPEFILYSYLSAGSYSESIIGGESFRSSSLSTFSGSGSMRLPFYLGKKLNWRPGGKDLYCGAALSTLVESFAKRHDTVVATSPSTGSVNTIKKSSRGSYQLQALTLDFHLTFLL